MNTTTTATKPFLPQISPSDLEELHHLTSLVHLFHHRNHNQHRPSIWWRHFCTFRRQLRRLLSELDSLAAEPGTHLARVRKRALDEATRARVGARLDLWQDAMVPRWQRGFSQLVADGRFAVLGVVLMAIMARVCAAVGLTGELEEMGQREVEKVLRDFERKAWDGEGRPGEVEQEDLGEVVEREDDEAMRVVLKPQKTALAVPVRENGEKLEKTTDKQKDCVRESTERAPKRKRKKGGNAIDDLFSSLE